MLRKFRISLKCSRDFGRLKARLIKKPDAIAIERLIEKIKAVQSKQNKIFARNKIHCMDRKEENVAIHFLK